MSFSVVKCKFIDTGHITTMSDNIKHKCLKAINEEEEFAVTISTDLESMKIYVCKRENTMLRLIT